MTKTNFIQLLCFCLGEDDIRIKALEIVLEKVLEDPHHDSVPSVNYTNEKTSSINSPSIFNDIQSFHDRMYSFYDIFYQVKNKKLILKNR